MNLCAYPAVLPRLRDYLLSSDRPLSTLHTLGPTPWWPPLHSQPTLQFLYRPLRLSCPTFLRTRDAKAPWATAQTKLEKKTRDAISRFILCIYIKHNKRPVYSFLIKHTHRRSWLSGSFHSDVFTFHTWHTYTYIYGPALHWSSSPAMHPGTTMLASQLPKSMHLQVLQRLQRVEDVRGERR